MKEKINYVVFGIIIFLMASLTGLHFFNSTSGFRQVKRIPLPTAEPTPLPSLTPTATPEPAKVTVMIGGDVMFDRNIRLASEKNGYDFPLSGLEEFFQQADLVLVNLEGPITDNQSVSVGSQPGSRNNFIFTFAPQILAALKKANINLVNLGNNHILNFGVAGYQETKDYLEQANIRFFGQIGEQVEAEEQYLSFIWREKGITIGFVNFNQFSGGKVEGEMDVVLQEIKRLRPEVDWLVVYPHWGNEYVLEPNQVIKNWAQQFVDVGADLVIGAHPHVEQINEVYQGKEIYYSLGNLVFDQYFQPEVRQGLVLEIEFFQDKKEIKEHRVELKPGGQTVFSSADQPSPLLSPTLLPNQL